MKRCVILAGGNGSRMGLGIPKYLLKVGGLPLIVRTIKLLKNVGVEDFVVVVNSAYKGMLINTLQKYGLSAEIVVNTNPERENGYSLYLALPYVNDGEDFIVVMADHVYSPEFVKEAVKGFGLIVDREGKYINRDEATKVLCINGFVEDIGKNLVNYTHFDTGFFILNTSISQTIESMVRERYVIKMSDIVKAIHLECYEVNGYFWMDVDTPYELKKARNLVVKTSVKDSEDGLISRLINRKISTFITERVIDFVSPFVATYISFLVGVLSAFITVFNPVIGGISYQISSILDGVDGEIARASLNTSKFGGYLDSILDRIVDFLFLLALSLHVKDINFLPVILLAVFGSIMISYSTERFKGEYRTSAYKFAPEIRKIPGKRDERVFLISVFAVLGLIKPLFVLLAVLTNLRFILTVFIIWRKVSLSKSKHGKAPVFGNIVYSHRQDKG